MIVGAGRVGLSLARGLAGVETVRVLTRSARGAARVRSLGLRVATPSDVASADLCVLAVGDPEVPRAARALARHLPPRTALVHTAGALTLDAFGPGARARSRGSFHPLRAVSQPGQSLEGTTFAVAATTSALKRRLMRWVRALHGHPLDVRERDRVRYHAAAVLSASMLVTLVDLAAEAAFRPSQRTAARNALLKLAESAIEGVTTRGYAEGLTGPVARGDVATIARHAQALSGDAKEIYRRLAKRALRRHRSGWAR